MKKNILNIIKKLIEIFKYCKNKIKEIYKIFFLFLILFCNCVAGYGEFDSCSFNFQDNNIEPKLNLEDEIIKDLLIRKEIDE